MLPRNRICVQIFYTPVITLASCDVDSRKGAGWEGVGKLEDHARKANLIGREEGERMGDRDELAGFRQNKAEERR